VRSLHERTYAVGVADTENDSVVLIMTSAAKVRHLRTGAKWRYNGRRYNTASIVPITQNKGESRRWELRGVPADD
jgi:FtsP/CotA-like multicopper oxidase with cupredoxin domain